MIISRLTLYMIMIYHKGRKHSCIWVKAKSVLSSIILKSCKIFFSKIWIFSIGAKSLLILNLPVKCCFRQIFKIIEEPGCQNLNLLQHATCKNAKVDAKYWLKIGKNPNNMKSFAKADNQILSDIPFAQITLPKIVV